MRQNKPTRRALIATTLAAAFAFPAGAADKPAARPADKPDKNGLSTPNQVVGNEITPQQKKAVELGLKYLASKQARNGSFGGGYGSSGGHAGITALAGIAFMAAGNLPGRGKYGENVQKCLDYVMSCCQESGLISSDNAHGAMYGHGFATLFLGEIYGMTQDEDVKEKLQKAVRLIERCQNDEGGWRYQPVKADADISVTICQVMGLRAARDAGIKVDAGVITKAIGYVKSCQNPDGGFSYVAHQGSGSGFARTAAGVASLYYAGVFESGEVKRGLEFLKAAAAGGANAHDGGMEGMFFYGNYYAAQTMFLAGGDYWATYYPKIRESLISRQDKMRGGWQGEAGDDYATAMALIILQMPNRYLPVFHGKGPGQ